MTSKHYNIVKKNNDGSIVMLSFDKLNGFDISPKNKIKYDGIVVNKMVILNKTLIEKLLKRKIKLKLESYLKLIMRLVENDDSDGDTLREVLDDLARYKSIIKNKYIKYLDEVYINVLKKKIEIIEYELKKKIVQLELEDAYEEELEETYNRRR